MIASYSRKDLFYTRRENMTSTVERDDTAPPGRVIVLLKVDNIQSAVISNDLVISFAE